MTSFRRGLSCALLLVAAMPSFAHHSFALFDTTKELTLNGVVKDYQWSNPHMFVQLVVTGPAGDSIEWSIEGASLNTLARIGWTRNTVKPGEKIVAVIHPMRDGSNGGSMVRLIMPDGRVLGQPEPTPNAL